MGSTDSALARDHLWRTFDDAVVTGGRCEQRLFSYSRNLEFDDFDSVSALPRGDHTVPAGPFHASLYSMGIRQGELNRPFTVSARGATHRAQKELALWPPARRDRGAFRSRVVIRALEHGFADIEVAVPLHDPIRRPLSPLFPTPRGMPMTHKPASRDSLLHPDYVQPMVAEAPRQVKPNAAAIRLLEDWLENSVNEEDDTWNLLQLELNRYRSRGNQL